MLVWSVPFVWSNTPTHCTYRGGHSSTPTGSPHMTCWSFFCNSIETLMPIQWLIANYSLYSLLYNIWKNPKKGTGKSVYNHSAPFHNSSLQLFLREGNICYLNQTCKTYVLELKRERESNLFLGPAIDTCIFNRYTYMSAVELNLAVERSAHMLLGINVDIQTTLFTRKVSFSFWRVISFWGGQKNNCLCCIHWFEPLRF